MHFSRLSLAKTFALAVALIFLAAVLFCACVAMNPPKGVPILEYHMVDTHEDADSHPYNVPPEDFAAQLDYLKSEGYTTITLMDLLRAKKGKQQLPEKPIILTFDDGYEDNYTIMLPLLEARGMTAVLFMPTNLIGLPDTGCRLCAEMREHGCRKNIIIVEDMEQAVDAAFRCTKQGMTCLMSPAASSYNVYKDFEHKGKHFKDLVKNHE